MILVRRLTEKTKRVVAFCGEEVDGVLVEYTLVRTQATPVTADRDIDEKVVKIGIFERDAPAILDFVTTIRMPRGWHVYHKRASARGHRASAPFQVLL